MHTSAQEFCAAHHAVMNKLQPQKNPAPLCPQTTHVIREELCIAESKLLKCVGFGVGVSMEAYRTIDDLARQTNPIEKEYRNIHALGRIILLEVYRSGCSLFFGQNSLAFAAYLMAYKLHTGHATPVHLRRYGIASRHGRRLQKAQTLGHDENCLPSSTEEPIQAKQNFGRKLWESKVSIIKPKHSSSEEISQSMLGKRKLTADKEPSPKPSKLLDFTQGSASNEEPAKEGAVPIVLPHLPITHPELQEPDSVNQPRILHAPLVPANSPMDEPQSSAEPCGPEDTLQEAAEPLIPKERSSLEKRDGSEEIRAAVEPPHPPQTISKLDRLRGLTTFLEDKISSKPAAHPATQCPELFPLGLRLESQAPAESKALAEPAKADGRSNQSTNATPQSVPTLEFIICPSEPLVRIDLAGTQTKSDGQIDDEDCYKRFFEEFSSKQVSPVEVFEVMSITMESIKQKVHLKACARQCPSTEQSSQSRLLLQSLCSRTQGPNNRPADTDQAPPRD